MIVCADKCIDWKDFSAFASGITLHPESRKGSRKKVKRKFAHEIGAFDIETTNIPDIKHSVIYHWQFQLWDYVTVTGRWAQNIPLFFEQLDAWLEELGADMVVYVHNLSFEFQFLSGLLDLGGDRTFCTDVREVLKCDVLRHIELRCSYRQSGESLDALTRKYHVSHGKLDGGEYDYRIIRWPWTPMSERERAYCLNDVRGLVEAMDQRREERGDTWYTIPLTKTGYIRRRVKKALWKYTRNTEENQSDYHVYQLLRRVFRGGNTHASRYWAGRIIPDVRFFDRSSSYPDVMINCKFPSGKFHAVDPSVWNLEYSSGEKAMLLDVRIVDLRLRDELWPVPYLSRDKCRNIHGGVWDNGRILAADYLETTITDVDLDILNKEYCFRIEVLECYVSRYSPLPAAFKRVVLDLYKTKTELKGVEGKETEYALSKEDINSAYGMCVQDPGKPNVVFDGQDYALDMTDREESYLQRIRGTPLYYAWGVWITAWARYRLEQAIDLVGERLVYTDTDSIGVVGDIDLEEYNADRIRDSTQAAAYAKDPKGATHYMGVLEPDKECSEFITFGAKKYAYSDSSGLHITIAGVNKRKGVEELQAAGGLPALQPGFLFTAGGGTSAIYNDLPYGTYDTGEGIIEITRNVYIADSTYKLGITQDYSQLLMSSEWARTYLDAYLELDYGYQRQGLYKVRGE